MFRKFHVIHLCLFCFFLIDLSMLFKLVSLAPLSIFTFKINVENHIYQTGIDTIKRVSDSALNVD
jgi:hypothetical protein